MSVSAFGPELPFASLHGSHSSAHCPATWIGGSLRPSIPALALCRGSRRGIE